MIYFLDEDRIGTPAPEGARVFHSKKELSDDLFKWAKEAPRTTDKCVHFRLIMGPRYRRTGDFELMMPPYTECDLELHNETGTLGSLQIVSDMPSKEMN